MRSQPSKPNTPSQALLSVVISKHPALSGAADPNRPLPLSEKALEALIAFLGCCRCVLCGALY